MANAMPPGGWPLRMAIFEMATGDKATIARQCKALLARGDSWENQGGARQFLWIELTFRHTRGEIIVRGRREGSIELTDLVPGLLRGSIPDYDRDCIDLGGLLVHNIQIFEAPSSSEPSPSVVDRDQPSTPGPKSMVAKMLQAAATLNAEGRRFSSKKDEHRAVLKAIGVGANERGYSYQTFVKAAGQNAPKI